MDGWASEDERLSGVIHLAATRPPMVPILGIPFSAAVPLVLLAAEVQMQIQGIRGLLYAAGIIATVTGPLRIWVSYDWYAVECLMAWARTAAAALDSRYWGGASVSHFPLRPAEPRGLC
jgi:type IV secretory pathway VirB3-like protein